MKIEALDAKLDSVNGEEDQMPTLRNVLKLIGKTKARSADDARAITRLVRKLSGKDESVELDDMELKVLRAALVDNPMNLTAFAQGQVLERLDAIAKG